MTELIKPITLEIDKKIWDEFKQLVPRTITLNDALVQIIEDRIRLENQNKIDAKGGQDETNI
jgi:hypothetical protein